VGVSEPLSNANVPVVPSGFRKVAGAPELSVMVSLMAAKAGAPALGRGVSWIPTTATSVDMKFSGQMSVSVMTAMLLAGYV
jgi:hypothetical protein